MQCNLSIVTQGRSGSYSTRTWPPRDGEQYFSVCLFFWMEEKLSQNVPNWLSLMAYWSGLCHMPRLQCQSLDKSSRMSRTVSDQWSSHQDHAVRLTEHGAAWAPPQTSSPCGLAFSLLVPYLVVLIPENSPHFGRSDNFSCYVPDFVIPKMTRTINHLLKSSSLGIYNGEEIALMIGDGILVSKTGTS